MDERIGGIAVGLAGQLREGVVSLGPDGTVEWANDAACRLLSLERDELVGTDPLTRVHPDEVARALAGIAFSVGAPDDTAVVPFRIRGGGEQWCDVELMSSVIVGDDGDHLVLVLRDASPRRAISRALTTVAAGEPIVRTAEWLAEVLQTRWPGVLAALVVDDGEGAMLLGDRAWPAEMRDLVLHHPSVRSLWEDMAPGGVVRIAPVADLPDTATSVIGPHRFTTIGVAPATDPSGGTAAMVGWFENADAAHMEFAHASVELIELVNLALERRHHLRSLDHAAHHDPLTGLLNRAGFQGHMDRLAASLDLDLDFDRDLDGVGPTAVADRRDVVLLYLDLDGFKLVNDSFGHAAGDKVLVTIADRLVALVEIQGGANGAFPGGATFPAGIADGGVPVRGWPWASLVAARIGGDEFVLVGRTETPIDSAVQGLADAVVAAVGAPMVVADDDGTPHEVRIGASVGVEAAGGLASDVHTLLTRADKAMYAVKARGGHAWRMA